MVPHRKSQEVDDTIPGANYADDPALHTNTPGQEKPLLHNQQQASEDIGLSVNAYEMEFVCFK